MTDFDIAAITPCVHLNGTDGAALRDGNLEICKALRLAAECLAEHEPNARDFYVRGHGAYEAARTLHESALNDLVRLRKRYEGVVMAIQEQIDARERRNFDGGLQRA